MGSTRFPGKVLTRLEGVPVLQWVVEAARKIDLVDHVIVATTDRSEDREISDWCASFGVDCFQGDSEDVLKRYYDCAKNIGASHVIRLTADCPLLDYETSNTVIQIGLDSGADYFFLDGEFPDGLDTEGFTMQSLADANIAASAKSEREHVTSYFRGSPSGFRVLPIELIYGLGDVRITLDYPEDLIAIGDLVRYLRSLNMKICPKNIATILDDMPHLLLANRHIQRNDGFRKSLSSD